MTDLISATSTEIAERVRNVLTNRGVEKAQQRRVVSSLLGLSTSQTYKKLSGDSAWDRTQLNILAEHFQVPLQDILTGGTVASAPTNPKGVEATLSMGSETIPVLIKVGERMRVPRRVEFVAYRSEERWHVVRLGFAPSGVELHLVESMEISTEPTVYSVAVLDDDAELVESICEIFNERDFVAKPFSCVESLQKCLETELFDAFILDWYIGQRTSEDLLNELRYKRNSQAPIVLLTGNSEASEFEIHKLVRAYSVIWKLKPTSFALLATDLGRAIEQTQQSR